MRPPSAVTATIAAILAGLGGLANVVGGLLMAFGLAAIISESTADTDSGAWTSMIAIVLFNVVAGVLLLVGAMMLLQRKMSSRGLVAAGCGVSIVSSLISLGMSSTVADYEVGGKGPDVFGLIFPIATIVLVLLPSTAAWIRAKPGMLPPPYPPPYRG